MKINNIFSIRQININELLANHVIHYKMDKGLYGQHHSSLRQDASPSLNVNNREYLRCGFDIIELSTFINIAKELEGYRIFQTIRLLEEDFNFNAQILVFDHLQPEGSTMEKRDLKKFQYSEFLDYIGIREGGDVADKNYFEIHYLQVGKKYFLIGLAKESGGREFSDFHIKKSVSLKDITIRDGDYDKILVFEVFIYYLFYLLQKGELCLVAKIPILNSAANIVKALRFLKKSYIEMLILNNDNAGQCTRRI